MEGSLWDCIAAESDCRISVEELASLLTLIVMGGMTADDVKASYEAREIMDGAKADIATLCDVAAEAAPLAPTSPAHTFFASHVRAALILAEMGAIEREDFDDITGL